MAKIGILEIVIVLLAFLAVIGAYYLAISKIVKSKLAAKQKIVWLFVIFIFNFPGLIAFLIYHDHYLPVAYRANL
jgi:hypothetical protein